MILFARVLLEKFNVDLRAIIGEPFKVKVRQ
ncbi:MAG: hypothetical protein KatS3mg027_1686 [Bacteroidia bacterium]|nr:MAG: hypothetical protein KatS3mg027_1686 [Bacteroidia bacterium]